MKKLIVVIAAAFIAVSANAQSYVGGGLGLNVGDNQFNVSLNPEVGYVFNENWSAGLAFSFDEYIHDSFNDINVNINPYVRYTFLRKGNFSLFGEGDFFFHAFSDKYKETDATTSSSSVGLGLAGGAAYQICDHISIVSKVLGLYWYENSGVTLGVTTPASIGVYYCF